MKQPVESIHHSWIKAEITAHRTVNYTMFFKDPVVDVNTDNIESYWNRVKTIFKQMEGMHLPTL